MNLFNINGAVGSGGYSASVFPRLRDLIAHMDYLQVDRSLVWQVEACDFNARCGNQMLLDALEQAPDMANRIIPALVVSPETAWQKGGMEQIVDAIGEGVTRAVRVFPRTNRFQFEYLSETLKLLAKYRPVILCDIDQLERADILQVKELAGRLPEIRVVLTKVSWDWQSHVFYLMASCENVYLDTSWLHVNDGIEKVVDRFGPDRVLWGLGPKTDNGASIAALAHAQVDDHTRELISHGNAERILEVQRIDDEVQFVSSGLSKPLWEMFRKGKSMTETEIIDAHGHVGPSAMGWYDRVGDMAENVEQIYTKLERLGVDQIVISPLKACFADPVHGNREFAEAIRGRYSDRISAYFVYNPHYVACLDPLLDEFFREGAFVGFKLLSDYWRVPVTDDAYESVWRYANAHRLIILIHTWNTEYDSPAMLSDIVKKYPDASFLLGHSGGDSPGRYEAIELAKQNSNVYLEFCGSFCSDVSWEWTIRQVGIDRVVFGSDATTHDLAWELGRFLSIPMDDEELRPALADNFKRLLSLRT